MTVEEIKQAHLAYWKHTESCWQVGNPGDCPEHRKLYDAWQAGLWDCWGVYVNTASIYATGRGKAWWNDFLQYRSTHRVLQLNPAEWHVMCDSEDDAWLLALTMEEAGIPDQATRVKKFSQCRHLMDGRG